MQPSNLRFVGYQGQFDDGNPTPSIGGDVFVFTATSALNVGDVVFCSGIFTVDKSNSAGNQSKVVGIVVGGDAIADHGIADFESSTPSTVIVGMAAAAAGQRVLVQVYGFTYAVADGAIANGAPVKSSSTVIGRVTSATAGTDAGLVIGRNFGAAAINNGDVITIFISAM